jgi:hypothetical protein
LRCLVTTRGIEGIDDQKSGAFAGPVLEDVLDFMG